MTKPKKCPCGKLAYETKAKAMKRAKVLFPVLCTRGPEPVWHLTQTDPAMRARTRLSNWT